MKRGINQKIKQLKHKSIFPPIVNMLLSLVFGSVFIALLVSAIVISIIESRFFDSGRQTIAVQQTLNERLESGESIDAVLDDIKNGINPPLAMNVYDGNGKLIEAIGEQLSDDISAIDVNAVRITVKVNSNDSAGLIVGGHIKDPDDISDDIEAGSHIEIRLGEIADNFFKGMKQLAKSHDQTMVYTYEVYRFAYWIGMDLDDANEKVCIKYEQPVYINDCLFAFVMACIAGAVLAITIITHCCNAVSGIMYQRSLLKLLLVDPVTGGNNMLAFENFAKKAILHKMKNAYAIVDFSLLKYQNYCTLYGMEEGERLICKLQYILSQYVGRGEYLAKISNSDFVLFLMNKNAVDNPQFREQFLDKMNKALAEIPVRLKNTGRGEQPLMGLNNILIKSGIYVVDPAIDNMARAKRKEQSENIDQLYMKAGIAKQTLSEDMGVMLYNHDMWEKELWEQKVEDTMQNALDNEEFQVYIQPKYHPSTEELKGGEALVRWISPTEGFISPGRFIPIFEKNGFVTKLDDYMISHTAALQAKWLSEGKKIVPISVNVSRLHFSDPELAEHIRDLVDKYELPRHYIEIELTESAFFDDKKALLSTVNRLQEYGFEVSMDDFGSGYSSLNSLKDLPLNVLKLDAEFFRGEDFDTRGEVVVSEAISLAKQLNMRVVAEGVEKKDQVDFLAKHNCDMIQGYYFDKPMPANEYESRM